MPARHLLPLSLAALLLAGCSGDPDPSETTEVPATTAISARNVDVVTEDGEVSLSLDGRLPSGWPTSFPLPPGTTPAGSGSNVRGETGGMVGVFRISGTAEDAFNFYRSNPDVPVTDVSTMGVGSAYVGRAKLTGPYEGSVTVGGAGGADLLVVVLREPMGGRTGSSLAPETAPASAPT